MTLDNDGTPAAFEHQMTASDSCGREITGAGPNGRIDEAEIKPEAAGSRSIFLKISPEGDQRCTPHVLQLSSGDDFQPSKAEIHVIPKPTHKSVLNPHLNIPH